MVCGGSEASKKTKAINARLKRDNSKFKRQLKILLLGTGESGKSTVIKQMKIIYGSQDGKKGFDEAERAAFRNLVCRNVLRSAKAMIDAMDVHQIAIVNKVSCVVSTHKYTMFSRVAYLCTNIRPLPTCVFCILFILCPLLFSWLQSIEDQMWEILDEPDDEYDDEKFRQHAGFYKEFWADESAKKIFALRNEYQLSDSTKYFFNEVDRIQAPGYIPDVQDVLRAREATTGIHEFLFDLDQVRCKTLSRKPNAFQWSFHFFVLRVLWMSDLGTDRSVIAHEKHQMI